MRDLFDLLLQPTIVVAIVGAITAFVRFLIKKENERKSFNKALLSEISRLLRVIVRHKKFWGKCIKDGDTDLPFISFSTNIYDSLVKDWKDVDHNYASIAASFYGYVEFLNRLQKSRSDFPPTKLKIFNEIYLNALEALQRDFMGKFNQAFKKFKVEIPN
jgi:hypothetical protein